jgi:hypothetical protein
MNIGVLEREITLAGAFDANLDTNADTAPCVSVQCSLAEAL